MGRLSATTLFIPLFYLLMSGYNCGDGVSANAAARQFLKRFTSSVPLLVQSIEAATPFWAVFPVQCFSGPHLVQVTIVSLFSKFLRDAPSSLSARATGFRHPFAVVAAFLMLVYLFILFEFDPNPVSIDPGARAHGRADAVLLTCKVLEGQRGGDIYHPVHAVVWSPSDCPRGPRGCVATRNPARGLAANNICRWHRVGGGLHCAAALLPPRPVSACNL